VPRNIKDFITKRKIMQYCLDRSNFFLILTFGGMLLSDNYISNTVPKMLSIYKINIETTEGFENVIVT
jgi:hypothetical protein